MKNYFDDLTVLVTGGAGFIGSHLVDRLLEYGARVTVVDSFITGKRANLEHLTGHTGLTVVEADVMDTGSYLQQTYQAIFHLASPASPMDFEKIPVETYLPNAFGTHYLLDHVVNTQARLVFASTSEVYGDPQEHPQTEGYWGHVNPVGLRSPYDVSKRFGEMAVMTYVRKFKADARIVRIFNTYGPRMRADDGRVIPAFVNQALKDEPLSVHGDGTQTRSFCFVSDLVEYILRAMSRVDLAGEIMNIGGDDERTVKEIAETIIRLTQSSSKIAYGERPVDDPARRRPELKKARGLLDYSAKVDLEAGLEQTIEYFRKT